MSAANDSQFSSFDIAIVGSGFCGTMLAIRLAALGRYAPRIALIDGAAAFGSGVAFGTTRPEHLLNVPAAKMSAFPESPEHFLTWLRSNGHALTDLRIRGVQATDFVPRAAYGRYLSTLLEAAVASSDRISMIARRVVDIAVHDEDVAIQFENGGGLRAATCVLAVGNEAPPDPPAANSSFLRSAVYVRNPWSRSLVAKVDAARTVLLVGSGLTAIDVALTIQARNPLAKVTMLSRRGRLPHVHRPAAPYDGDFGELTGRESIVGVSRSVRAHVRRAQAAGGDWRPVVDALRPHTQRVWRELSPDARKRFLRHARPVWEIHRHRSAPAVDASISRMQASGILEIVAGRLTSLAESGGRAVAVFVRRADNNPVIVGADLVVNCTGPRGDYTRSEDRLWRNLIAAGEIRPDPLGLGIDVDDTGAVIGNSGCPSQRLYAIGSLRRGVLYESTAVPELRQQVKDLADELSHRTARDSAMDARWVGTAAGPG